MSNIKENPIVKDVLKGTANSKEISEVVKWFATDEGQDFLSDDFDESVESLLNNEGDGWGMSYLEIPSDKMLKGVHQRIRFRKVRHVVMRVAAVLVPFAILIGFALYVNTRVHLFGESEYLEVYVPKGEQLQMIFQDGSRVYLNSDTHLRYPKSFSLKERKVYLEGEGYFVVEKNSEWPFVVKTSDVTIHVLGTSFNVEAYPEDNDVTLSLDQGSIDMVSNSNQKQLMKPGEKLVYNKQNDHCVISKVTDMKSLSAWKNKILIFENASLEKVLTTLSRWYDVNFEIGDEKVLEYSYTLEFSQDTLTEILSDMEKVSPIRFTMDENVIKITIKQ